MNCVRIHFAIAALLLAASAGRAIDLAATANPYATVVTRNMFGLVPVPTNVPVEVAPPEPPIKITPNGIMSLFNKVQVLFKTPGKAKAGQPAKEESYIMSVGERQDEIEVLEIDEPGGKVKFNNHGMVQELALVAAANVPSPVVGGPAGAPGGLGGRGAPGMMPAVGGGGSPTGGARFGRSPRGKNVTSSEDLATANNATASALKTGSAGNAQPDITPENQILLIEAQRQKYQADGNPMAPILPPLPPAIQKQIDAENGGGASGPPVPGQ